MMFVLLLTISLIEVNVVLSYGMGRDINTVCPERHSCRSSNNSRAEIYRYCKCDGLCEAYDDCCDDYVRSGSRPNSSNNNNTFNLSRDVISCKRLFYRDDDFHYTVDRCPRGWPQGRIRNSCSSGESNSGNIFARVPVVGRQSSILYRNAYCAVCNGEHDVVFSKGRVESNSAKVDLNSMEFLSPQGYSLRTCINAIRTCNSSYRSREVKRRCTESAQSNSLMILDTTFYRNADCAKCNFVNESKQMCGYHETRIGDYPHFFPPYETLIDYNSNTIETTDNRNGRINTETFRCSPGRRYDLGRKKCVPSPLKAAKLPRRTKRRSHVRSLISGDIMAINLPAEVTNE